MLEIQAIQKSTSTTNGHVVSDPVFSMIPASKDLDTLAGLYKKELESAAFKGAETIYFPSLSCSSQPLLFRAISQIYRTILDFGDAGDTSVKKSALSAKMMISAILIWLSGTSIMQEQKTLA